MNFSTPTPTKKNFQLQLQLLVWAKSFRTGVSCGFFHKVPKEPHNIFKDFEDEMTSLENIFFSNFTLVPPYVHNQKINEKSKNSNDLYIKLYKTVTIILQSIVRHC
jgi:hypothetical protein